jgi:enamine deaminase RidA (YjgF/YER057c/UK114 family)
MRPTTGLHLDYLSLAERCAARWSDVLGLATFGAAAPIAARDVPVAHVGAPLLTGDGDVCELWSTGETVRSGRRGALRYRATSELLFGCISIAESALAAAAASRGSTSLHEATLSAYREMLAALQAARYPHLVRVWNYLGQINTETHGLERYRQFNSARALAFAASGHEGPGYVPAACALGTRTADQLVLYFLASRARPLFIENPRQVSAYHYPRDYGPRSPLFARAAVLRTERGATLFISGTASIVGHRTVHAGDAAAQTRETLTNIQAVIAEANLRQRERFTLAGLTLKVYVRRAADLPVIQRELRPLLGPAARVIYLEADICRQDLLVEIEATGSACGKVASSHHLAPRTLKLGAG